MLGDELSLSPLPEGVEVVTVAERPELLREAYPLAAEEGYADLAVEGDVVIKLDDWLRDEATLPEGSFVALHDGEIIGYSGLMRHDNPGTAEDGLTVVAPFLAPEGPGPSAQGARARLGCRERHSRGRDLDAAR